MTLRYNKVCEFEDFSRDDLVPVIREVGEYKMARLAPGFPAGSEHRKDWEVAMAVRSLRDFGALHREARILGVGAGTEDTVFFLTRHAGQVFATDRYVSSGAWQPLAPLSMMVEPDLIAPFQYEPDRLVVQHMDGRALRYPDNTFDGIFSSGSIEHFGGLSDVAAAAYEMGRVLKPGGILALSTEFRFSGPPGGIGWENLTLLLSEDNLRRYVIEASGLEMVDELSLSVSEPTLATPRDLTFVVKDHLDRVAAKGGVEEFTEWDFPHLILVQGGYVFGSVHLTLRKGDNYPSVPNSWAQPSDAVRTAISEYNRSLIGPSAAPADAPVAVGAVASAGVDISSDQSSSGRAAARDAWRRHVAENDRGRGELAEWVAPVAARSAAIDAGLAATDQGLLAVDGWRREVDDRLGRLMERQSLLVENAATEAAGVVVGAADDASTRTAETLRAEIAGIAPEGRICRQVTVDDSIRFWVMLDLAGHDVVAEILSSGHAVDQSLLELMLAIVEPGDLVVDLGAHVGTFTLAAAAAGCSAVAVEAAPANVDLLRASVARNGFHSVYVVHAAASDASGTVDFHAGGAVGNVDVGTGRASAHTAVETLAVPAVRIDDLLFELGTTVPAFVKMDIEGSEVRALQGLSAILSGALAPPVLVESNGHTLTLLGSTPTELLVTLEGFGYTAYLVEPNRLVRCRSTEMQTQTLVDYLAVKRVPGSLPGWRVESGMGFDERLRRIVADCAHPNPHHRAYMAKALATSDDAIVEHPEVRAAAERLIQDSDEAVRQAAGRWHAAATPGASTQEGRPDRDVFASQTGGTGS